MESVLQAFWIRQGRNDSTSNNPSTKLSIPSKAITSIRIHSPMRGDNLLLPPHYLSVNTPPTTTQPLDDLPYYTYTAISPFLVIPHLPHADPSSNDVINTETRIEVFVIEPIQES
jgi:hypothetical protein